LVETGKEHPMRLVVINPNSTASMTEKIVASARAVAGAGVEV